jgi:hypothetical protein
MRHAWGSREGSMPTFTYSPTDSVTIAPNGDVSVTDGATTTTYSKGGATKTITKIPPDPNPPPPEAPVAKKNKGADVVHTYTDLNANPPVTTKITFKGNGDIEIVVSKGQDRTKIDINGGTGVRRTRIWTEPAPEPTTWGKTETPPPATGAAPAPAAPSGGSSTAPVGSPTGGGGKKPKKKPKRGKAARTARKAKPKKSSKVKRKPARR